MRNIRVLALAALTVAAVGSAQAFTFEFNSVGKYTVAAGTLTVSDTNVVYDVSSAGVAAITYSYAVPGPAVVGGGGTITLTNVTPGTINFVFNGNITSGVNSDALSGNVVSFFGGTGALAGYTGTGSISNTTWKSGADQTTFVAELVPEPASMAVFGLGLVGIAVRRRRSK